MVGGLMNHQSTRSPIRENMLVSVQAVLWIKHHPNRVVPVDCTDGQMWIVSSHRTSSHNDSIHDRPQSVQSTNIGRASHVVGVTAFGGDAPIKALSRLCDYELSL
jgi:hypothetical protein